VLNPFFSLFSPVIGRGSRHRYFALASASLAVLFTTLSFSSESTRLQAQLKDSSFKIAHECYVDDNWEIFVMNADGSNPVNLTHTPKEHEHYPQISPDGSKICFSVDDGEGREAVRSLYVMDIDGSIAVSWWNHAREPFWSPDGKVLGFSAARVSQVQCDRFLHQWDEFLRPGKRYDSSAHKQHESSSSI
jgi:Tol biopolymer transport system component